MSSTCPKCQSKAYVGLLLVECENPQCDLWDKQTQIKVNTMDEMKTLLQDADWGRGYVLPWP